MDNSLYGIFQEWRERKKFQKRLIAAKKKLCEMEQQHVFHGLRYGEKEQRSLLSDQIVGVNSKLLQEALQSLQQPAKRQVNVNWSYLSSDTSIPHPHPHPTKKRETIFVVNMTSAIQYILLFDSY